MRETRHRAGPAGRPFPQAERTEPKNEKDRNLRSFSGRHDAALHLTLDQHGLLQMQGLLPLVFGIHTLDKIIIFNVTPVLIIL